VVRVHGPRRDARCVARARYTHGQTRCSAARAASEGQQLCAREHASEREVESEVREGGASVCGRWAGRRQCVWHEHARGVDAMAAVWLFATRASVFLWCAL